MANRKSGLCPLIKVFFSSNEKRARARDMARDLVGYKLTEDNGISLGMPLLHRRINKNT